MRTCATCRALKPKEDFYEKRKSCKTCIVARAVERARNYSPEKKAERLAKQLAYQKTEAGKLAGLKSKMKYRYGITLDQYNYLLSLQDGRCYLCGEEETVPHHKNDTVMRLAVDHDHSCCPGARSCGSCIRALLCYNCNRFMGRVDKSVKLQSRFQDYLHRRAL